MRLGSQIIIRRLKKLHVSRKFKRLSYLLIIKQEYRTDQSCLLVQLPPFGNYHTSFKGLL